MNNRISISSEAIGHIVDFYRIQPKVGDINIEKIEEYLLVMNSHYSESMTDLEEFSGSNEDLSIDDIIDVLNSYLSLVGEELNKIFKEENNKYSPIEFYSNESMNEIQVIELLRKFNGGEENLFQIKTNIDQIETIIYEEDFALSLLDLIKDLIEEINGELVVRVDDLI